MYTSLALLRPQPLSNRLWQGGGLVGAVVVTLLIANQFLPTEKSVGSAMLGHDFLAFYTAGTLARGGEYAQLYDLDFSNRFQHQIGNDFDLELAANSFGPYWNPPFYAWVFAPLAELPYSYALLAWVGVNLLCAGLACAMLGHMVAAAAQRWPVYESQSTGQEVPSWRLWMLVPFLMLLSMPFIQALSHGQNSMMSLLILSATVMLWRGNKPLLAGMACGLLFYKPQLAAIVALMLTLTMGWRALAGLVFVGLNLLALQELSMPGSTLMYLQQLPANLAMMQVEAGYLWERHVTLKAFWRLLLQGRGPGETSLLTVAAWVASSALVLLGLGMALVNTWKTKVDDAFSGHTRLIQRDRLIAATIAAMPLLMPFYFDYDLLLIAIPMTLLAIDRIRSANDAAPDHLLVLISAGLYLWLMINPGLARNSGVNVTVPLVAALAGLLIMRACRENPAVFEAELAPAHQLNQPPAARRMAA